MKKFLSIVMTLLMYSMVSSALSSLTGINPMLTMLGIILVFQFALPILQWKSNFKIVHLPGVHTAELNKEVWIDRLLIKLDERADHLQDAEDMTEHVDNNTINFADEGQMPEVEIDRTDWPIPVAPREDLPLEVKLNTFSSNTTLVQDYEAAELAYNKLDSVNKQHVRAINRKFARFAIYNWAPATGTDATPIIETSGAANTLGFKKLVAADIARLSAAFDAAGYPDEGRTLNLTSAMLWEFVSSDPTLLAQYGNLIAGNVPGVVVNYLGWKIRKYNEQALFRKVGSIWTKQAFEAVAGVNDLRLATAYIAKEGIMKAYGTVKMYTDIDTTATQGTEINYAVRATAKRLVDRNVGGIIQVPA